MIVGLRVPIRSSRTSFKGEGSKSHTTLTLHPSDCALLWGSTGSCAIHRTVTELTSPEKEKREAQQPTSPWAVAVWPWVIEIKHWFSITSPLPRCPVPWRQQLRSPFLHPQLCHLGHPGPHGSAPGGKGWSFSLLFAAQKRTTDKRSGVVSEFCLEKVVSFPTFLFLWNFQTHLCGYSSSPFSPCAISSSQELGGWQVDRSSSKFYPTKKPMSLKSLNRKAPLKGNPWFFSTPKSPKSTQKPTLQISWVTMAHECE